MKKSIYILCVIIAISACSTTKNNITTDSSGNYFEIKKGDTFEINFVTNASTGFAWFWTNKNEISIADSIGVRTVDNNPKGYVGGSTNRYWKFEAVKKGTDTLEFEYRRPWDAQEVARQRSVVVTVK